MAAAFSDEEIQLEQLKINEEKALYENLKQYVDAINYSAATEASQLNIVASGYELNKNKFIFVVYSKKNWQRFVGEGLAFTIEGKCSEIVTNNNGQNCTWSRAELIKDELFVYRYKIPSAHTKTIPLSMVNHYWVELLKH